jgi:hypothetical protein
MDMSSARPNRAVQSLIERHQQTRQTPRPPSPAAHRRSDLHKVAILGNLATGKTSIVQRQVTTRFAGEYLATIGAM